VLTRPFAPREQRRVTVCNLPRGVSLDAHVYHPPTPDRVCTPTSAAVSLEPTLRCDEPVVFGVCHTDSNQHVNSLVYPRIVEERALRRLHALGARTAVVATACEVSYRRPCFAGDTLDFAVRVFECDGGYEVIAAVLPTGEATGATLTDSPRAHALCWMKLEA